VSCSSSIYVELLTEPQPKSSKGKYIGAGIAIAVIGVIMIVWLSGMSATINSSSKSPVANVENKIIPQNVERRDNIINGIIGVDAGGYQFYSFSAPSEASGAKVEGSYTASGGSGNDIKIYILDETGFTNWRNGHQVNTYYNSGQLTTGKIDSNVPVGKTLYLVYDNTFSTFSNKHVTAKADLVYSMQSFVVRNDSPTVIVSP